MMEAHHAGGQQLVLHFAQLGRDRELAGQPQLALQTYIAATLLQSVLLRPADEANWLQLGLALDSIGDEAIARAAYRAALLLRPSFAEAYNNLSLGLKDGKAVTWQRRAVQLVPQNGDFHTNLAHLLLSDGQFAEGFREWDWRLLSPPRDFNQPVWDGQDFAGRTLLVHAEQGYGDTVQFCRYLPQVARLGGRLLVESRRPLAGLLQRIDGVTQWLEWGETLPDFDLQIAMPSLAARFPEIPLAVPYLTAAPDRVALWQRRLPAVGGRSFGRKIGLVWEGNRRSVDKNRAIPVDLMRGLAASHPECQFFGLQRELSPGAAFGMTQLGEMIEDFDDLAAILTQLDLLISVDTASAHLAGALGCDLWVLLHQAADWRWRGVSEESSAWYPTARIFRQRQAGDWTEPLSRVSAALRDF